jgi:glycosyltransferase involved in cell wall biosynthesis
MIIVYCLDSINGIGGIQRVTVIKANALAEIPGNEVWVIVADSSGRRMFELSPTVHLIDLSVNYYEDDWKSKWYVLKGVFVKRQTHKKRLAAWLNRIRPDIVVSIGQSEKFFLPRIKGNWATIREFHFVRGYRRKTAKSWFEKTSALVGDMLDLITLRNYDRIVLLTQEDRVRNWGKMARISVIPNPSTICLTYRALLEEKRVIAVGRLSYQKNYASMIRAFSLVAKRFPEWRLDVYGDGDEKESLTRLITKLSLNGNVNLLGISRNVCEEMLLSSVFVLSSRFEGMSLVLIEAMTCGVPVVSYACPCGPQDIISDGVDGYLVPVGDEKLLAERICRLIEDAELRKRMGAAAFERSKEFSIEKIIPMWMDLFEELVRPKKQR